MIIYKAAKKVVLELLDGIFGSIFGIGIIVAIYFAFISRSEDANKYFLVSLVIAAIAFIINHFIITRVDKLNKENSKPDSFLILILSAASLWAIIAAIAYFMLCILETKSDSYYFDIMVSTGCVVGSFLFACIVEGIGYKKNNTKSKK